MNTTTSQPFAPLLPRICVIDDNPSVGVRMQKLLNTRGYRNVTVFRSAMPALEACHFRLPDLVLVDYGMPQVDGIRFIEALRNFPPARKLPIVMFTGQSVETLRPRALEAGASDVLSKDLTGAELMGRVKSLLAASQLQSPARPVGDVMMDRALLADASTPDAGSGDSSDDKARDAARPGWGLLARYEHDAPFSDGDESLLLQLARIASLRDHNTGQHTSRMAHYAAAIGRRYGLSMSQTQMVLAAAPLHDLGKVGVPDSVLHKTVALSDEEMAVMRRHPLLGFELLRDSPSPVVRLGAEIALSHHERWDGSGYPQGLRGEAIALSGRLVAVADALDALTSERPYKTAWPLDRAIREIVLRSGTHFDPAVVDALIGATDQILAIKRHFEANEPFAVTAPLSLV